MLADLINDNQDKLAEILSRRVLPLSVGQYLRSIDIAKRYLVELLSSGMFKGIEDAESKIESIGETLSRGYPHHGYCIDADEAKHIGLEIICDDDCWETVWEIYMLFDNYERNQKRKELKKMLRNLINSPEANRDEATDKFEIISEIIDGES